MYATPLLWEQAPLLGTSAESQGWLSPWQLCVLVDTPSPVSYGRVHWGPVGPSGSDLSS